MTHGSDRHPPRVVVRPPGPDQLDRMLRVTPSYAWAALAVLAATAVAALAWSVVSTAPIKVAAQGILLTPGGVADVAAPAAGRLAEVLAAPGARVVRGQAVARVEQPDVAIRLDNRRRELAGLKGQRDSVEAFHAHEASARRQLADERRAALQARADALKIREWTLAEMLGHQRGLFAKGIVNRERVLSVQTQLQEVQGQRAEAENAAVQLATDEEAQRTRAAREVLDIDMRIAAVEREIDALVADLGRSTVVTAPQDGRLVELSVNIGEMVAAGAPVMRMLPDEGEGVPAPPLVGLLYVSPGDGKKVRPGMAVQVIPSTVRVQRDGFIRGVVASASAIHATREGMMRTLKNTALVEQLTRAGAPVEVVVRLSTDPASPSGFQWSSGPGPDRVIEQGTMMEGRVVVDRVPLVALAVPQAERLLAMLGL